MRVADKVALITGGARGQGRAIAKKLASEGANIALLDACRPMEGVHYPMASPEDLMKTKIMVEELGRECIAEVGDVRVQEDLDRLVNLALRQWGQVDILCANAGVHQFSSFWEITEDQWNQVISIDLTGVWHAAKAVAPHMIERTEGCMVLTSSVMGREASPRGAHYVAAKHGVIGLTKAFALELGRHNIRVNAVLPSVVHTPMGDNAPTREGIFGRPGATTEDYVNATRHWHALRSRPALAPSDIADAVIWLCSDESKNVTGIELAIDAGHGILEGYNHDPVIDPAFPTGPYD